MDYGRIYGMDADAWALVPREVRALATLDFHTFMVLESKCFAFTHRDDAMAADAAYDIVISVGAKPIIIEIRVIPSASFDLKVFEGTTHSDNGSALPIGSVNRDKQGTPTTSAQLGPTVTGTGVMLFNPIGLEAGNKAPGVSSNPVRVLLARNTEYLMRMTNTDGANAVIHMFSMFYEIDD